jgi:hypothetical protein
MRDMFKKIIRLHLILNSTLVTLFLNRYVVGTAKLAQPVIKLKNYLNRRNAYYFDFY